MEYRDTQTKESYDRYEQSYNEEKVLMLKYELIKIISVHNKLEDFMDCYNMTSLMDVEEDQLVEYIKHNIKLPSVSDVEKFVKNIDSSIYLKDFQDNLKAIEHLFKK